MEKYYAVGALRGSGHNYRKVFLIALLTSFAVFLPFMLMDNGYFLYYGDFNVQQIPFYMMTHDAIRAGNVLWNWTTDLGANFIGSYSFYNLGSPFFWLTLPFPSSVLPYMMAPLLMLKTAVAAVTAYAFIARFVKNRDFAVIGGLLYAFSGFTTYNIFFNHFHEPIAFFPLLLIGLEEYMQKGRRGVFALAVLVNCFVNYFFFTGQVVFVIIYWLFRMRSGAWKIDIKKFGWLAFEAVVGVAMSAVILFPSVLVVLANPRASESFNGFGALFYGWNQRYGAIFQTFFFPPDIPARPNFFPGAEAKWASIAAWLPLFSMCGVIAFIGAKRGHWLKLILCTCFVMAMVPVFNSAFYLFNSAYYARWFYMLVLMMALATVMALEDKEVDYKSGWRMTLGITVAITLLIGFLPAEHSEGEKVKYGLMEYPDRFWVYVAIALVSLILLYLLLRFFRESPRQFYRYTLVGVLSISVIYSIYFIALGKVNPSESHNFIIPYSLNQGRDIDISSDQNYRVDVLDGPNMALDNQAMFWQIPTIQTFHSVVPASIMEFYPSVGVRRDVGSRAERIHYALRPLLSVRYLFDRQQIKDTDADYTRYHYLGQQNGYYLYENRNYIPMGFTYDRYATRSQFERYVETDRQMLMLKAIVLDDVVAMTQADILPQFDEEGWIDFSDESIAAACDARKQYTCHSFTHDNTGFTGRINLPAENLVFFSVPWEEGWSATVNGQPADIIKANVGFMAVRCPAGESTIRFDYMTPGLQAGLATTAVSLAIFLLYVFGMRAFDRRRARRAPIMAISPAAEGETYYLSNITLNLDGARGFDDASTGERSAGGEADILPPAGNTPYDVQSSPSAMPPAGLDDAVSGPIQEEGRPMLPETGDGAPPSPDEPGKGSDAD